VLDARDFLEIETPILTRATPEGARDFLVPAHRTRQLLRAAAVAAALQAAADDRRLERYFQIARCFRDEDSRADRQPEFTQLDVEMSFVTEEDVIALTERVMSRVFEVGDFAVAPPPWPRLPYAEAMARYGIDRPDTRFGLEIHDVSELVRGSEFKVFEGVLAPAASCARSTPARASSRAPSRTASTRSSSATARRRSLRSCRRRGWRGNLAKFFTTQAIEPSTRARRGGRPAAVRRRPRGRRGAALGALRLELGERFGLIPEGRHDVLWIVDFPMFEWSESDGRFTAVHHPFTAPAPAAGASELDFSAPAALRSRGYDLVCDGVELGGGSIRIHTPEIQREVFKVIGLSEQEATRASASCSTRCATGRRRSAGSRSASTGSSR
jgi:aspartyl-tRNA synthetase